MSENVIDASCRHTLGILTPKRGVQLPEDAPLSNCKPIRNFLKDVITTERYENPGISECCHVCHVDEKDLHKILNLRRVCCHTNLLLFLASKNKQYKIEIAIW